METLQTILLSLAPDGSLVQCTGTWAITGKLNGYPVQSTVSGDISLKSVTDVAKELVGAVLAEGPPPPPDAAKE
jgi:hypothetical protein